jgi:hypothetical protein
LSNFSKSNKKEVHLSFLGKYTLIERSSSKWGINVKYWLKGLEETNNNAVERVIVLHGWSMIEDKTTCSKWHTRRLGL